MAAVVKPMIVREHSAIRFAMSVVCPKAALEPAQGQPGPPTRFVAIQVKRCATAGYMAAEGGVPLRERATKRTDCGLRLGISVRWYSRPLLVLLVRKQVLKNKPA